MKNENVLIVAVLLLAMTACGGGGQSQADKSKEQAANKTPDPTTLEEAEKNWQSDYGIGPVSSFELPAEVDADLVAKGMEIFDAKCTACHKVDKQFIGPEPKGILTRRTPAWIMNMILNPDEMVQKNHIAKQLLIKFNGSPMANQNLTEEEARAVLEYFRTL
ncbi:MAG: cytochrome c [Cytophagales bacterium]|nr:cytochrome c [Cytophagales bacterium]